MRETIKVVEHSVAGKMTKMLAQPFTEDEAVKFLFQMHSTKALGLTVCVLFFITNFGGWWEIRSLILY